MRRGNIRLWVPALAVAFAVLWLISAAVSHAAPSAAGPAREAIGMAGWILVGLGAVGVLGAGISATRVRFRRKSPLRRKKPSARAPQVFMRSVAYVPGRRPVVQRRYYR